MSSRQVQRLAVIGVGLVLAAACAGRSDSQASIPGTVTNTPAPSSVTFEGTGYRFTTPPGWFAKRGVGRWDSGVSPAKYVSGFDTFTFPAGDPWLVVGHRPARRASLKRWIADMVATKTITYPPTICAAPERVAPAVLGGAVAELRWFHCPVDGPRAVAVQVLALHGGQGFAVMCYTESGVGGSAPAIAVSCQDRLRGFQFVD